MSRLMMEVEIYAENDGLLRELTIEGDHVYTVMFLDKSQSYEVADKMEAIVEGRCREPFELVDGKDSLTIEECGRMEVRINLKGVCGIMDRQAVKEIAHDLRYGWEGAE